MDLRFSDGGIEGGIYSRSQRFRFVSSGWCCLTICLAGDNAQMIRRLDKTEASLIRNEERIMICPFCRQSDLLGNPGKTVCPSCKTVFEIDERGECVFVDTDSLRMPMYGQVCAECGLV